MSYDQFQEPDEKFWTPALRSLVVVNLVFILLIIVGLVTVFAAFNPAVHDYILDIFD
ncbi:MAG TPA: hypothetical protein VGF14_07510 [Alphaproteobacteria bacterium]